jgi:AcrR family transcriptional regulator
MPRNPEETRLQLIRAAERLFAERGIEVVSLREINRAAGQRNATALQYHFGDRRGLVRAILARHELDVEAHRHLLLDELELRDDVDVRAWSAALVLPVAKKLSDRDRGREFLRIMAELINRPEPRFRREQLRDERHSINRWRSLVAPKLPELAVNRLHRRFTAIRILFVELARRAESSRRRDDGLFVSHLVDLIASILAAPISDETLTLLAAR